jgi:hypothetical protein
MIVTILSYAFIVWLGVAALLALIIGFSVWRLGGWTDFADAVNILDEENERPVGSIEIQWIVAALVIFWPFLVILFKTGS